MGCLIVVKLVKCAYYGFKVVANAYIHQCFDDEDVCDTTEINIVCMYISQDHISWVTIMPVVSDNTLV